jgi:hypothetical protein
LEQPVRERLDDLLGKKKWTHPEKQESALRRHPDPVRHTLLAAFLHQRDMEVTDGIVRMFLNLVHRIQKKAHTALVRSIAEDIPNRVFVPKGLLLQRVLEQEDGLLTRFGPADFCALTPLFPSNINPFGEFKLHLAKPSFLGQQAQTRELVVA